MKRRFACLTTFLFAAAMLVALFSFFEAGIALAAPGRQTGSAEVPFPHPQEAVEAAVNWLTATQQNEDGGYGTDFETSEPASNVGNTLDAILAIAAAGEDPAAPVSYLQENGDEMATFAAQSGGAAGKLILALEAAGQEPGDFAGHDFVITLTNQLSPTGQYNVNTAFDQSLAILGLSAVSQPIPDEAVQWLLDQQATEGNLAGSWDDGFGTPGNPDATAMAIMALIANGMAPEDEPLAEATQFLAQTQLETGGWEYGAGFGENANSTALVIQALGALGEDFYSPDSAWAVDGRSPLAVLLSWQSESGAFQVDFGEGRFENFLATAQAIPAVATAPKEITTVLPETQAGLSPTATTPEETLAPTETVPPAEAPTETPEPTEAPQPTATTVPSTEVAQVSPEPTEPTTTPAPEEAAAPAVAGGDSILPFVLLAGVVILVSGLALWLYVQRRQ